MVIPPCVGRYDGNSDTVDSHILNDELYRKRFLPTATDADMDDLARKELNEKYSGK